MKTGKRSVNKRAQKLFVLLLSLVVVMACIQSARANSPADAKPFALNGVYSGDQWLTEEGEENWFILNVPEDGYVEFRIMSYCSGSLSYKLQSSDLSATYKFTSCNDYISGGSETSPKTGVTGKALSAGNYYFCLSGTTGKYRLMGSFTPYKVNDSAAHSYDNPQQYTLGTGITGAITETDGEDWFKFKTTSYGNFKMTLRAYENSLSYVLYNSDLSVKYWNSSAYGGTSTAPQGKEEKIALKPGTYYIKFSGDQGKYNFNIKVYKIPTCKLSVKAKAGKKYFTIKTTPYADVQVKYGGYKWNRSADAKGKVRIDLPYGKKLKKGKKIKVTATKVDYKKKSGKFKVKK